MDDLIERIKRAEGPDRELDLQITMRVKGGDEASWLTDELGRRDFGRQWAYTASLDAAMTLLPEGAQLQYQNFGDIGGRHMWLVSPNERYISAATDALALTAACLKARKP